MGDYIDRENYCKTICRCDREYCDKEKCPIWTAPSADVRPAVWGRWLHETEIEGHACGECSACHKIRVIDNFCPNCGADMRGGTKQ